MLLIAGFCFLVGMAMGLLPGENLRYKTFPIAYLTCFFGFAISYAFMNKPIDVELFFVPMLYPLGAILGQVLKNLK